MTNREYLNEKSSTELATWLDEQYKESEAPPKRKARWNLFPNFKPSEFVCKCGKCEMSKPEVAEENVPEELLFLSQSIRNEFGTMVITCGGRCKEYNDSLPGSVPDSAHLYWCAIDYYIPGVTNTVSGREKVVARAKKLPGHKYSYHNSNGKYPNMGSAIHSEVHR